MSYPVSSRAPPTSRALELRWSGRVCLAGLGFSAALLAFTAWVSVRPDTSGLAACAAGALTLGVLVQVVSMLLFRVRVDGKLLTRRTLRGADTLAWEDIEAAILVATHDHGAEIVHQHTLDPAAASHALIYPRGGGRRWHFHAWMTDFPELVAAARSRGLVTLERPGARPPTRGERLLAGTSGALDEFNATGMTLMHWVLLAFVLLFASFNLVAGFHVSITGDIPVDLALLALALLGAVFGLSLALRAVGARRHADRHTLAPARGEWPLKAASLIGGALLVTIFLPDVLDGTHEHPWLDVLFTAVGAVLVHVSLRAWLRGE